MPSAPRLDDETARLDALRRYQLFGRPPEQALDDLTKLAAYVCQTPMSVVSFVGEHRQWFTSCVGIALAETARDLWFCAHALHETELMVVPDARLDPRFADHPFVVAEPGIRFYAGAPLRTPDGLTLGTLCVFDYQPRELTVEQLHALRVLGRQAMAQIELRRQALDLVTSEAHALGTMRRRAEETLRVKTIQLEAALGIAQMGVWFGNLRTDEVFTVHDGGPVTGLPPSVAPTTGAGFMQLVHPEDRAAVGAKMARALRNGRYDAEFRIQLPDGEIRWVSARGQCLKDAVGEPTFLTGVDLDITERKRADARLQHLTRVHAVLSDINQTILHEPRLDAVLSAACRIAVEKGGFLTAWIGLVDPVTGSFTRHADAHAGADAETLAIIDRLIERDPPAGCAFTRRAIETRRPAVCHDIAHDVEAASWRDAALARGYRTMASFALALEDRTIGTFNIYAHETGCFDAEEQRLLAELATDISFAIIVHERERERQRADDERRLAEDRFRQLAETIQQVFWMTDVTQETVLYVSPAFETIWGRPCADLYASPRLWMESVHPDDRERVEQAAYTRSLRGDYDEVYRILRPDGTVRWIRDRAFPLRNAAGDIERLLGTAADVTEQRQLEEQLQQAQKMESVGRLAGGIAHDFNNLLTVINGMADLVIADLDEADPHRHDVLQIRQAGERAAALTGRLLAISRRQMLKPEVLNLTTVVEDLQGMVRRLIGEDVELVFALARDLGSVKADPGQIEQVLLNLVVNARDAMPDGGVLTIETRNVELDAAYAGEHPGTRPGWHAMIAVSDTGTGMDDVTRRRIFEPFFTTKALGKGTGLGLSMVYGIVKQSGGSIWVYSEPAHGSAFKIYLPRVFDRPPAKAPSAAPMAVRGHETVLVVEDEPALRELTKRVLSGAGYSVLEAANGADALALIAQHEGLVQLAFTDVVMPGMNGRELAARLAVVRPGMRVLYTSGYTEDAILRHGVLDDATRFLSKPYTPAELRRRIREALDG